MTDVDWLFEAVGRWRGQWTYYCRREIRIKQPLSILLPANELGLPARLRIRDFKNSRLQYLTNTDKSAYFGHEQDTNQKD